MSQAGDDATGTATDVEGGAFDAGEDPLIAGRQGPVPSRRIER
jgi:hypothetical protein